MGAWPVGGAVVIRSFESASEAMTRLRNTAELVGLIAVSVTIRGARFALGRL